MRDPMKPIFDAYTTGCVVPKAKADEIRALQTEYALAVATPKAKFEADLQALNEAYYASIAPAVQSCTAKLETIHLRYARRIWRTNE